MPPNFKMACMRPNFGNLAQRPEALAHAGPTEVGGDKLIDLEKWPVLNQCSSTKLNLVNVY